MANLVVYTDMRSRVRNRIDEDGATGRTPDAWIDQELNQALRELRDDLIGVYGQEYFVADPYYFVTVPGTQRYALPDDFMKLLLVSVFDQYQYITGETNYYELQSRGYSLEPFAWDELHDYQSPSPWGRHLDQRYRVAGDHIYFRPTPSGVHLVELRYIPSYADLSGAQTFDDVNGWSIIAELVAAKRLAIRNEDSNIKEWDFEIKRQKDRLTKVQSERDAGKPMRAVDLRRRYPRGWRRR